MLKNVLAMIFIFSFVATSTAQTSNRASQTSIWLVDFVKAKDGKYEDYLESLRQNGVPPRIEAEKQKFTKSHKLLIMPRNSSNRYDYILMTEFASQQTFDEREENFNKVFDKIGRAVLIKGLRPRELADIVESTHLAENIFER
jgi:hypothetical protein